MNDLILEEFVELDAPEMQDKGMAAGKWYVGAVDSWKYYLRDDYNVHFGVVPSPLTGEDTDAQGYFDSEEDATIARFKYYQKHDQLDLLG